MKHEEFLGNGAVFKLYEIVERINPGKIFFVTGKNSFTLSGAEQKIKKLTDRYKTFYFNDFSENPKMQDAEKGTELLKASGSNLVIAIGGGSVIDMAKLVNIFAANTECDRTDYGIPEIKKKGLTLIAVPTTSGAGSESTHFAVLYKGNEKFSVAHEYIMPDIAVIDPELTYTMTPELTAITGMDALSQAIESYWSVNSTEESKKNSSESISIIKKNLAEAVKRPSPENRYEMSRAANLSGKAINIAKTTGPHAVSYAMTSYFGIPHGQAVSITLGEFMKFNYGITESENNDPRGAEYVKKTVSEIAALLDCKDEIEADKFVKRLMKEIGLKTRISEFGIPEEDPIKIITENVNTERLKNNPRKLSKGNLEKIIGNIL